MDKITVTYRASDGYMQSWEPEGNAVAKIVANGILIVAAETHQTWFAAGEWATLDLEVVDDAEEEED